MTYVEGEAMVPERGGSATFARHAFRNELVSFIAGWAILIDYVIVIALAALSVPHYLTPIWSGFTDTAGEIVTGGLVIAGTAVLTTCGFTGAGRPRLLTAIALAGVTLLIAVIVVGVFTVFDISAITDQLDPFTHPDHRRRDLRGRDRDGCVRGDRGGCEPRARHRDRRGRPAQAGGRRGRSGPGRSTSASP